RNIGIQLRLENIYIGSLVSEYLKEFYGTRSASVVVAIDMADIIIESADFSNVDFSNISLINVFLSGVNLTGARLTPRKHFGVKIDSSNWWDSDKIDQELLASLLQNSFPYANVSDNYPELIDKKKYEERISKICNPVTPLCKPENLIFGDDGVPTALPTASP
ncbi:MAG: pentapeptide repeat-containing protein, partial [Rhodomicrobium sp.]